MCKSTGGICDGKGFFVGGQWIRASESSTMSNKMASNKKQQPHFPGKAVLIAVAWSDGINFRALLIVRTMEIMKDINGKEQ